MTISALPLGYCTNVHPSRTLREVHAILGEFAVDVAKSFGEPMAVGLWLNRTVATELDDPLAREQLIARLHDLGAVCYTLNAFPFGDFHSERVKEQVYVPDWSHPDRLRYTTDCARILADLLPPGAEGSISTVPLGIKPAALSSSELPPLTSQVLQAPSDFLETCCHRLIDAAVALEHLARITGRVIRLAIEPEPMCVLETTSETLAFFELLRRRADERGVLPAVVEYIGVCYDVCHQAVEFEDVEDSLRLLDDARIRINKVHLSCAIDAPGTADREDVRTALRDYVEPRYLHQVTARTSDGRVHRWLDLDNRLLREPPTNFVLSSTWRVHFHVPVDAESLGPLGTTRQELRLALNAVAKLAYAPHLEVETYTWHVLPGAERPILAEGMARELRAASLMAARARALVEG